MDRDDPNARSLRDISLRHHGNLPPTASAGTILRALRESRHLSQRQLAERLDISASFLSLLESGSRRPAREHLVAIAHALQLDTNEEHHLLASAGFAVNDVETGIERVVELIAEQVELDELDYRLVLADLKALAQGWLEAFLGVRPLRTGDFQSANEHYAQLAQHGEYSPTLMAYLRYRWVYALLRTGELSQAKEITRHTRRAVDTLPTDWAPALRAEIIATEAMLALRDGNYEDTESLLAKSKEQYTRLVPDSTAAEDLMYQGFGRFYKRLAQMALFQGNARDALTSCLSAEAYLSRAPTSITRDLWLRRTRELKGWALSKLGTKEDVADAIALHSATREASEQAGDAYGVTMGSLYLADDLRRGIQLDIARADRLRVESEDDASTRRSRLREALEPVAADIERAEAAYLEALAGIQRVDDHLMKGRCLSGLAIIQRFKGSLVLSQQEAELLYDQAQLNLERALTTDTDMGQGRRIPGVYATMATLTWDRAEWDPGQLFRARDYFRQAWAALESPKITTSDLAALRLRKWLAEEIEALQQDIQASSSLGVQDESGEAESAVTWDWHNATQKLATLVHDYIRTHRVEAQTLSDKDDQWLMTISRIERMSGARVLAQNTFSVSLSLLLPAGSHAGSADIYRRRYELFKANVESAQVSEEGQPNRDLCCRKKVEEAFHTVGCHKMTREQIRQALAFMQYNPRGYLLESSIYELPLAFMVKDAAVLVEIPKENARRLVGEQADCIPDGHAVCYEIYDKNLAQELKTMFDVLVKLAEESIIGHSKTVVWLSELVDQQEPMRSGSAIGGI